MSFHVLYTAADFTKEEAERGNIIYQYVVEQGLDICKGCGAAESEVHDFETCEAYSRFRKYETFILNAEAEGSNVQSATTPCCGKVYKSLAPLSKGGMWDALCECPHCGKFYDKVVTVDSMTLTLAEWVERPQEDDG